MTNKASDSTSGAGMELKPCPFCGGKSIDVSDGFSACCNTCLADGPIQIGERGVEAAARYWNQRVPTDASRLLAEREERIAKLKAALTALRRSHDADVDGHGLTVGQLLVINEALKD